MGLFAKKPQHRRDAKGSARGGPRTRNLLFTFLLVAVASSSCAASSQSSTTVPLDAIGYRPPATTNVAPAEPTATTMPPAPSGISGQGSFDVTDLSGYTYRIDWSLHIYNGRLDVTYSKPGNGVAFFDVEGFVAITNTTPGGRHVSLRADGLFGISAIFPGEGFDPEDCSLQAPMLSASDVCGAGVGVHWRTGDQLNFDLSTGDTMHLNLETTGDFGFYASEKSAQHMVDLINNSQELLGFRMAGARLQFGDLCAVYTSTTGELLSTNPPPVYEPGDDMCF